jgi:hypothetical protein
MSQGGMHYRPPRSVLCVCGGLVVVGAAALAYGLVQAPERAWLGLFVASFYLLTLGLGALVFVALQYVTGAGWSVAFRRVPEAMGAVIPVAGLGVAVVLVGRPSLYPWAGAAAPEAEAATPLRQAWFHYSLVLARAAVYLGAWCVLGFALVQTSRRQDRDGAPFHTRNAIRLSGAFLVVFAVTFWLATYDWLLSLDAGWSSTAFGVYQFAGLFLGGLAAVIVLAAWLRRLGPFRNVLSEDHVHDLGKLLFGFSTFWMYLWFCQYMLIWYVNNPEETSYFTRRLSGAWGSLFSLNLALSWGVPFLVLLPRWTKRRLGVLTAVALVVLAGRWLDLYLGVFPAAGQPPGAGAAWEVGLAAGAMGLFGLVFFAALGRSAPVPVGDPLISESLPAQAPGVELSAH